MGGSQRVQRGGGTVETKGRGEQAMPMEILSFLVIAASLVLVGFASGPLVARRVTVEHRRRVR
jgi:hypothetical protein